ncbi:MAG: hypothetical protein L6R38_000789 [Xanthoria sp. 2 TBL-2021]|nr:MAG: hypothetical protein L6R38_000789 [Xanthoria sp. 2 TBL-2021]
MSPREATQTDAMNRLGLTSAYEALEMAGYVPNRTPSTRLDRIGTFYGQTSDDWRDTNASQIVDTYFVTAGVRAFAPGRINFHFKFSGPSYSIDTACSSSMAAIQLACTSLWAKDCDTAVTGGLNVMTNSDIFAGLSRGQFLSKTGNCQTFDNDADGYCCGDGITMLILKRLEATEADNDRVLGLILETSTGQGTHYTPLGRDLYELNSHFGTDILSFDSIAIRQGFPSVLALIQGDAAIDKSSPMVVQVGLTCLQMALARFWATWGVGPDVVLGHSLGEYAALNAAGVLSISDPIFLVGHRAKLLEERCTVGSQAMLASKSSAKVVSDMIATLSGISIACINGPQETVLSGTTTDIDVAANTLSIQGVKSKKLNLQYAFHSSQIDVILDDFEKVASVANFHKPKIGS